MASPADEVAALRGTKPATFGSLLRHPAFSRLWRAMLVSSLGDWVGFVAVTVLVTDPDIAGGNPAFAVSGVMLARLLPSIVFGPFAGVLVDRFDRRKLMVISDISRGVMYASLPFLGTLPAIYLLSFAIECFSLLWAPARDASVPNLVPRRQLANANTLGLATTYGTLPLGGVVFTSLTGLAAALGTTIGFLGERPEALAFWLDGLTFGFSAYMISRIPMRGSRPAATGKLGANGAVASFGEGIRYLRGHRFVRAMTIGIVLAFIGVGSVMGLGPVFARRTLGAGPSGWGVLITAVGIGLGIGMASLGWLQRFVSKHVLFPSAMVATAATGTILALMPSLTPAAVMTVVVGATAGVTWVTGYTLLHENISDEMRGRTFATLTVLSRLGLFVSLAGFPALAGALGDRQIEIGGRDFVLVGTRLALLVGAVIVLMGGILSRRGLLRARLARLRPLVLRPRLRKVERRGAFVVFEGVEGAGKGTQIRMARDFLMSRGIEVLVTREPGGTDLGERVREAVLDTSPSGVDPRAETLLFAASRAQHVASVIRPALESGSVVICDRYIDSSLAYQGAGRGLGEQDVLSLNAWATQGLFPDLVILLDVDVEEGLARAGRDRDRIEAEDLSFHAKVAEAYLHIAEEHPERFVVIDASRSPQEVHEKVCEALLRFLENGDS
ncbi:MAG TPA: dTMP kinase [Actinomycetota bacterium]|nr:dTMP kinase [Actinomycetota bacterium]